MYWWTVNLWLVSTLSGSQDTCLVSCLKYFLPLPEAGFTCDVAQLSHRHAISSETGNTLEIHALSVRWVEIVL